MSVTVTYKTYIYGLKDPRDGSIFYVGKSDDPDARLKQHCSHRARNEAKKTRIASIENAGYEVGLVVLQEVLADEWREAEIYWIAYGAEQGWPLTNVREGGEGGFARPDYSFMRSNLPGDFWDKFNSLSLVAQNNVIVKTAQAGVENGWRWPGQHEAMTKVACETVTDYVSGCS